MWRRCLLGLGVTVALLLVAGCKEDNRNMESKLAAPSPDYATRWVMSCPKCGAPTKPYRISDIKSFYRCSGQPPKFKYHEEHEWTHRIDQGPERIEK